MYEEKKFNIGALQGLSEKQISEHLKLYAGYVKNTNELMGKIKNEDDAYTLSELRRRLGFEFNGMRLHEYYFGQFEASTPVSGSLLRTEIEAQYGSVQDWQDKVVAAAMSRGIGWVLVVKDQETGRLIIQWVSDHDIGMLAGVRVIMALDVWEHAYLLDYLPSGRKDYINAFLKNLNWAVLENRFSPLNN